MNQMTNEDKIQELTGWFFDQINVPIIEGLYIHDPKVWDTICASLTILGDLQRAKREYHAISKINYLEVIGIMQTIYIEQDCMLNLQNAILGKSEKTPLIDYKLIRDLRNEAFGHPSERQKKGVFSRHFFDIEDEDEQRIKIINWESSGDINSNQITLSKTVDENSKVSINYLIEIKKAFITKIKDQMNSYQVNLTDLFKGANYTFEKLLTKQHDRIVIDTYYGIEDDIKKAIEGLTERKLIELYQRDLDVIIFFSDRLKGLFNIQTYLDTEFYAYAISLRREIHSLKKSFEQIVPELNE
jgi:hypothetical protein